MEETPQTTDPDLEERIKSLEGIKCGNCLDSGFIHEWVNGAWHIKYEEVEEVTDGKKPIRLIKCSHGKEYGF